MNSRNVVLIGYRATGKTSVGRVLSRLLERPVVDLDQVLEAEAGQAIAEIVARQGWDEFRRRESRLVARYAAQHGLILATGGGVVLDPENVRRLKANGFVVWLTAPASVIQERLQANEAEVLNRPPLSGSDAVQEVEQVLQARLPLYRRAADLVLTTDGVSPEDLARQIITAFRQEDYGRER